MNVSVNELLAKIGALTVEMDFLRFEVEKLRSTWTPPQDDPEPPEGGDE